MTIEACTGFSNILFIVSIYEALKDPGKLEHEVHVLWIPEKDYYPGQTIQELGKHCKAIMLFLMTINRAIGAFRPNLAQINKDLICRYLLQHLQQLRIVLKIGG